jgi:hypothetical protein
MNGSRGGMMSLRVFAWPKSAYWTSILVELQPYGALPCTNNCPSVNAGPPLEIDRDDLVHVD